MPLDFIYTSFPEDADLEEVKNADLNVEQLST